MWSVLTIYYLFYTYGRETLPRERALRALCVRDYVLCVADKQKHFEITKYAPHFYVRCSKAVPLMFEKLVKICSGTQLVTVVSSLIRSFLL